MARVQPPINNAAADSDTDEDESSSSASTFGPAGVRNNKFITVRIVNETAIDPNDEASHALLAAEKLDDVEPATRQAALEILMRNPDALQSVAAKVVVCLSDRSWFVRKAAAAASARLLDLLDDLNAVVDALVNALRDDESDDVRVAAARAFGPPAFNEDSERVATALSAATEDSSWAVRASAVSALARCARSSGAALPPAVAVRIAACLGDAAAGVRSAAADAFAAMGREAVDAQRSVLAALSEADADPSVREAADRALRVT